MTRVYFRKWNRPANHSDEIIAVFPDQRGAKVQGDYDTVMTYGHFGSRGTLSEYYILQNSTPASPGEYRPLMKYIIDDFTNGIKKLTIVRPNQKTLHYAKVLGGPRYTSEGYTRGDVTTKVHL